MHAIGSARVPVRARWHPGTRQTPYATAVCAATTDPGPDPAGERTGLARALQIWGPSANRFVHTALAAGDAARRCKNATPVQAILSAVTGAHAGGCEARQARFMVCIK
eukprot:CAMPEP_0179992502 /NCGR_PEP_ID=MMETSP0984-20121128/5549_1 /TAXON_ID=483367 /ORGANISM="non described non described, Strain CCMP 2436" /LENGTH=107 /DNA_ID=CAMNT_0021911857 /DNA_START=547 /DNA_END=870 /DNA_ORIENTATION=-